MKQVRIHGPEDVRIDEVAPPEPGPRDAVIGVHACGICGSDVGYVKLGGVAGPTPEPMRLGHELAGVILRVGAEVEGLAPGTRVTLNPMGGGNQIGNGAAQGGFTPELLVPNVAAGGVLFALPDDLAYDSAALAEPLGVGMQAVNRAGIQPGEKAVIFGAGPIGLMALATCRYRGIEDVIVVDRSATRLAIATKLGAKATLCAGEGDLWKELADLQGKGEWLGMPIMAGADAFIEATGAASVIPDIIAHAKEQARIAIVALHRDPVPVDFLSVMAKGLSLLGSIAYPDNYEDMIEMLREVDLTPAITHRFGLDEFATALRVAQDPDAGGKVLIEF
ncbi:MAG: zinc-binding dehydrogenase [Deltaproteobacteria bacterium]